MADAFDSGGLIAIKILTAMHLLLELAAASAGCMGLYLWWRERLARLSAEQQLQKSEMRLSETQKLARIGSWEFDIQSDQIRWSEETFHIFGLPAGSQELDFADVLLSIHPEDAPLFDRAIQRAISDREVYRLDLRIQTPEGQEKHIFAQGSPVTGESGRVERIIGTVLDITERKRAEQLLAAQATYDALTGLVNRRFLLEQLEREMEIARRYNTPLAVCICDLDMFKTINDSYGHWSGDELLAAFAKLLAQEVRRGDLAGRLGGDEFCILFPRTEPSQAFICIERIRTRFEKRIFRTADGRPFQATATFGIAELKNGMHPRDVMQSADSALYQAKQLGRNCSVVTG